MFVSRDFTRENNLKPVASLIVKGDESPHKGLIIDVVDDDRITKDLIDDVDVFGDDICLDEDSRLELLPPHDIHPIHKVRPKKKSKRPTISRGFKYESDSDPSDDDDDDEEDYAPTHAGGKSDDSNVITIHYIFGRSGSGKSYKSSELASNYKRMYPERNIVLISPVCDNKRLLSLGVLPLNCIDPVKAYENFVDNETAVTVDMFRDALVIADDLEVLEGDKQLKPIKEGIDALLNKFLTFGRHQNTSICLLRHKPCDYRNSKGILAEAQWFTFFPNGSDRDIIYTLDKYCGLDKTQIKRITSIRSRAVTLHRHRPRFVLAEHEAYIL